MSWAAIGAMALALVVIFIFGQLWFALIEAVLEKIKRLFSSRKNPPVWHTFSEDEDKKDSK